MPIRVQLATDAIEDLKRYAESGNLPLFLKKLLRLEEVGKEAGLPLGGPLTGWRKIVVGDRNWRIVFNTDPAETVATIWVIGDRADAACYADAQRRIQAAGQAQPQPQAESLAAVIFQLTQLQRAARQTRRQRPGRS